MGSLLNQLKITDNKIYSHLEVDLEHRSQRKRVQNDYSIQRLIQKTRTFGGPHVRNRVSIMKLPGKFIVLIRLKRAKRTPKLSLTLKPKQYEVELPYKGIIPFPGCTINDTEPTRADRESFDSLKYSGELLRLKSTEVDEEDVEEQTPYNSLHQMKSQVKKIVFRDCEIDTWYTAPYPAEYSRSKIIFICEHCLQYMNLSVSFQRHQLKKCSPHPPGLEIYTDPIAKVSIWEVDGRKNVTYCQNLCLLAKLFLNLKTLYYDVEPFIFYILAEIDEVDPAVYHFVGYFSKEKLNSSDYNVSCILTLPIYQRKGYGNFLIDFSYLLSRSEFKFGTPEKPLSDLGLLSYRNYWKVSIAGQLRRIYDDYCKDTSPKLLSIEVLSKLTGMIPSDVVVSLEQLNSLVKNPNTGTYSIAINLPRINKEIAKWKSKGYVTIKPELLLWKPMLFGPSGGINSAPPMMVPNSISLITNFLKDDINSPFSFEDEALREFEEVNQDKPQNKNMAADDILENYQPCFPGIQFKKKIPIKQSTEKLDVLKDLLNTGTSSEEIGEDDGEFNEDFEEDDEIIGDEINGEEDEDLNGEDEVNGVADDEELNLDDDDVNGVVEDEEEDSNESENEGNIDIDSDSSIEVAVRRSSRVHKIEPEVRRSSRRP